MLAEEREIDLIDLLAEVLRHWKGMIVCFLIGALALGIYGYVEGSKETIEAAEVTEEIEAVSEAQKTEMTFAEKKAVDIALEYEALYVQAKDSGDAKNLIELNKAVLDSVKSFNDMQLQYFMDNSISDLWKGQDLPLLTMEKNMGMSMKTIIIGGLVLSLLYTTFWVVRYIFDGHIKVSDDMILLVKVPQLGFVSMVDEPKFLIDKWVYRLKHHGKKIVPVDKAYEIIASCVAVNAKKKDVDELTIIGTGIEGENSEYFSKLSELLSDKYNLTVNAVDDIVYNQESIAAMSEAKSAVLVETVGESLYTDLYKEIQLLNQLEIPVLGGVIVE